MMEDVKEAESFFLEVLLPQLRKEAANGRWEIVSPENFVVSHFGDGTSQSIAIGLVYHVKDVWDIYIGVCAVYDEDANGNYFVFEYNPVFNETLEANVRKSLNDLNAHFFSTLPSAIQKHVWVCSSDVEQFVQMEIFNIEELFDTLCNQLDEILPQFAKFT